MKAQVERLIQTAIHSNPLQIICGISDSTTIDFGVKFIKKPVCILTAEGSIESPIYISSWTQDGNNYYTGVKVSDGTTIHWLCVGVFIE